jgi:hypothetical protein
MLELESPRWCELRHAYGDADDLPPLLRRLASGDSSVMSEIFGSVCHQGSVYSASYATVPHLVATAETTTDPELRAEILILIGSIRASSDDRSDIALTGDLQEWYEAALPQGLQFALATLGEPIEPFTAVYLLQAASALKGYLTPGRILSGFLDEEFCLKCPACHRELYVWPDEQGLSTTAEDPVFVPTTTRTPVAPGPLPRSPLAPQYHWLMQVAGPAAFSVIGARLSYLFGSGVCPACGCVFSLIDELGKETS